MSQSKKVYRHGHGSDEQHKKDQALFAELLDQHHLIKRTTTQLPNGIQSQTTTEDAHLAQVLIAHVVSMQKRFDKGRAIRSWDPLFSALFEYRDEINMAYHALPNGVEAVLTSDDPKLVELIHKHDETLFAFINHGGAASANESPKPDWLT